MVQGTAAGRLPGELTVDELAAAVGMTVRNVRAYAGRGLIAAPRLVGRTGYYQPEHVARLTLVREMLAQGFTLAAVERTLATAPADASPSMLALQRALLTPYLEEEPEEFGVDELAAQAGMPLTDEEVAALVELGLLEPLPSGTPGGPGQRVRALQPSLLRAGLQVVRLGVPVLEAARAQAEVARAAGEAATVYVRLFRDTVWRAFADRGMPDDEWAVVQAAVERVQPVAAQALLAAFRRAMAQAVEEALGAEVAALSGQRARVAAGAAQCAKWRTPVR